MRTIKANQISFGLYSVYVFEASKLIEHYITPKKPKNLEEEWLLGKRNLPDEHSNQILNQIPVHLLRHTPNGLSKIVDLTKLNPTDACQITIFEESSPSSWRRSRSRTRFGLRPWMSAVSSTCMLSTRTVTIRVRTLWFFCTFFEFSRFMSSMHP